MDHADLVMNQARASKKRKTEPEPTPQQHHQEEEDKEDKEEEAAAQPGPPKKVKIDHAMCPKCTKPFQKDGDYIPMILDCCGQICCMLCLSQCEEDPACEQPHIICPFCRNKVLPMSALWTIFGSIEQKDAKVTTHDDAPKTKTILDIRQKLDLAASYLDSASKSLDNANAQGKKLSLQANWWMAKACVIFLKIDAEITARQTTQLAKMV